MLLIDPDRNRLRFASRRNPGTTGEQPAEAESPSSVDLGHQLVPALLVREMRETLAFYERLGFRLTGSHPSRAEATWAEVRRDSVVLQFHTEPACGSPPHPVFSGTFYIFPESVAALAGELRGKVEFACGPEVMDYGMYEFGVQDPNGYFIAFTEPAGEGGGS